MIAVMSNTVFAEPIQPYYTDTNMTKITLSFSSDKATCSGTITGKSGTTSITNCTVKLTDSDGNIVKSWTNLSTTGTTLTFSKTATGVTKGKTYTLTVSATVNTSNSNERVSDSISKKY